MGTKIHFSSGMASRGHKQGNCLRTEKESRASQEFVGRSTSENLMTYKTIEKTPTGETPFSLTYGMEALIPTELSVLTIKVLTYNMEENMRSCATVLDLIDELRDNA